MTYKPYTHLDPILVKYAPHREMYEQKKENAFEQKEVDTFQQTKLISFSGL